MDELRRMSYLQALGVDGYVSRVQLPGAAPSRRLAMVRSPAPVQPAPVAPAPPTPEPPGPSRAAPQPPARQAQLQPVSAGVVDVPRFSLAAMVAGEWLWLEELGDLPLARDQVHLVQAMAHALCVRGKTSPPPAKPDITQFDWPIHNNRQLDSGGEAARAALAGFLRRKLEQGRCRGAILLGERSRHWVSGDMLAMPVVATASTAQMLADPGLKPGVWRDLSPLASPGEGPAQSAG